MTQPLENSPTVSPLAGYMSVSLESITPESVLPYSISILVGGKLTKLRSQGDVLPLERVKKLQQHGVDTAFISEAEWKAYLTSLESGLDERGISEGNEAAAIGLRNVLHGYLKGVEQGRDLNNTSLEKIITLTSKLPTAIGKSRELAHKLLRRFKDPTMYFSNHAINVAIYSIAVGLKLRIGATELTDLALAAIFANIGIVKVPKEILYKPGPLTPEEWQHIYKHPTYGREILSALLISPKVCDAVWHHHERFDGKGYPQRLAGDAISLYARIICIGETYSAVTSHRPWQPAFSPHEGVQIMQGLVGKFDPSLFVLMSGK